MCYYYRLFYYLEHNELLNPIDTLHLFTYIPRINQALQQFVEAWNHHGVRWTDQYLLQAPCTYDILVYVF